MSARQEERAKAFVAPDEGPARAPVGAGGGEGGKKDKKKKRKRDDEVADA